MEEAEVACSSSELALEGKKRGTRLQRDVVERVRKATLLRNFSRGAL